MKLLQTEIDVVPGRKPQKQPLPEGYVGTGAAVLRITNTTARQNAYTVRLRCEQPFWQDNWYTLAALPPTGGPENQPPPGKPDQLGPRNQTITIYVSSGGTRDIFISFAVPEKSESRAGIYPFKVVIETRIVSDDPVAARKERVTELPGVAVVRPFYKWTVAFAPEEKKVGFFKRKGEFEVVIENQGNDWLYCDLKIPRPQNVLVEASTLRVSVPPPEPEKDSTRTVPIGALSRVRAVRGAHTEMPLPLTVVRVDAPSVPPLPEEAMYGPVGANLGAAVVEAETTEVGAPTEPARLTYCPLIPATLTGFFEALVRNGKGLVMAVLGLIIASQLAIFTYHYFINEIRDVDVMTTSVKIGKKFKIRGKNLWGSQVWILDKQGKPVGTALKSFPTTDSGLIEAVLEDKTYEGQTIYLGVQRLGKGTFLASFLPIVAARQPVLVGEVVKVTGAPTGSLREVIGPRDKLQITGMNFGKDKGVVQFDDVKLNPSSFVWTDDKISITVPAANKNDQPVTVLVFTAKGDKVALERNQFVVSSAPPPGGPGDPGGGPPGGGPGVPGGGEPGGGEPQVSGPGAIAGTSPGALKQQIKVLKTLPPDVESLSLLAIAQATIKNLKGAEDALKEAAPLVQDNSSNQGKALFNLAMARYAEARGVVKDRVDGLYFKAVEEAEKAGVQLALIDICYARFKLRTGDLDSASGYADSASAKASTQEETDAIAALKTQIAKKRGR